MGNAVNGGFEEGSSGWTNWGGGTVVTDATKSHTGNNYVQLSVSSGNGAMAGGYIPVSPGETVVFGGWAYLESGSATHENWNLVALDSSYSPVAFATTSPATPSSAWTYQVGSYTVGSGVAYVQIYSEISAATSATVARFDDAFVTAGTQYYHQDQLSNRLITDVNGNKIGEQGHFPFGESWYALNTTTNWQFTTYERDGESGNDYAVARYYPNRLGRFMSPDWSAVPVPVPYADLSDPQALNLYSYVRDNPLSLVDPDGHCDDPETCGMPAANSGNPIHVDVWQPFSCLSDLQCMLSFLQGPYLPSPSFLQSKPQSPGSQSRLTCAANYGQNHSIAAAFGAQNSFVGNLFGGNTFSNLAYLGQSVFGSRTPTGGDIAGTILGGAGQGLPGGGPGFKGAAGQASDAIVGGAVSAGYNAITGVGGQTLELGITASGTVATIATPLAATTVGTIVGYANLAKLALDAGTFAYGAIFACH